MDALDKARVACLGEKDERTSDRSTKDENGEYTGGLEFERGDEENQAAHRVFTTGESYEYQSKKMAPAAPGKVHGGWPKVNQMRKDLLKVRISVVLVLFKTSITKTVTGSS